jgi:hypothetical protein
VHFIIDCGVEELDISFRMDFMKMGRVCYEIACDLEELGNGGFIELGSSKNIEGFKGHLAVGVGSYLNRVYAEIT